MFESTTYTPPELAKRWRVKPSKVLTWIRCGELDAIDVSSRPGIGRPRFRVSSEAVERFELGRAVKPKPKRRRQNRSRNAKQYV